MLIMSPYGPLAWSDLREERSRQDSEQGEPGNAVKYLAPSVTWKREFHLCEGVEAKLLMTLGQHWLMAVPAGLLFTFDPKWCLLLASVRRGKRVPCAWSYISPSVYLPDGCQLFGPGLLTLAKKYWVFMSSLLSSGLFTCCFSVVFLALRASPKNPSSVNQTGPWVGE